MQFSIPLQIFKCTFISEVDTSRCCLQATAFHSLCDGAAPSLVLVRADTGHVCGGFTDVPWSSSPAGKGRYVSSDHSFLFSLHAPSGQIAMILASIKMKRAKS